MAQLSDIHPVRFNFLQHCSQRDARYRQLVQYGDETQFQMQMDICNPDVNMVLNPAFSSTANWNASGSAFVDIVNGWGQKFSANNIGQIDQVVPVADGVHVYITFQLDVQNGSMKFAAGTYSEIFTASGTYSRWIEADSLVSLIFEGNADANWTITSVGMYVINTNFSVIIEDVDGIQVREVNPVDDPQYFDFTREYFTFSYDWEDELGEHLPEGCYRFLVSDPCDCLNGGLIPVDFVTGITSYWNQSGTVSWFIVGGTASYTGAVSPDSVWIENAVCKDVEYELSYTLANMAGSTFAVRLGTQLGIVRNANGTYTEDITTLGSSGRMIFEGSGTAFEVTDFSITRKTRSYGFRSNLFTLKESVECTCVISACCDSDNMQAGFVDTNFVPRIRLKVDYGDAEYEPITLESFKSSFGLKRNYYYRGEKTKRLAFAASEYVHDFMGHLMGYDHVYLDGVPIFVNSNEYTIEWEKGFDYGEAEIRVSNKQEFIEKRRCSSVLKGCDDGGLSIAIDSDGKPDGGSILTDTAEGEEYASTG